MNILFFCEGFFLETLFFLVIGLLYISVEICGVCSLCQWPSLLTWLTLISNVTFCDALYEKKVYDSTNLKQLI